MTSETGFILTGFEFYTFEFQNSSNQQMFATYSKFNHALKFCLDENKLISKVFEYIPNKKRFSKIPKKRLKLIFSNETETLELLKKFNLI